MITAMWAIVKKGGASAILAVAILGLYSQLDSMAKDIKSELRREINANEKKIIRTNGEYRTIIEILNRVEKRLDRIQQRSK